MLFKKLMAATTALMVATTPIAASAAPAAAPLSVAHARAGAVVEEGSDLRGGNPSIILGLVIFVAILAVAITGGNPRSP